MEVVLKRHRGRPRKEHKSIEEMEDDVIIKFINHEPMTFEEAALALWMHEGRKTPKPLSKARMIAIEAGALAKIREKFTRFGIKEFGDVYEPKFRRNVELQDRVDGE